VARWSPSTAGDGAGEGDVATGVALVDGEGCRRVPLALAAHAESALALHRRSRTGASARSVAVAGWPAAC
jgi:hypothetical protein